MKKIALIHQDFGIGGAERLMLDIALCLRKKYEVTIYTSYFDKNRCFEEFKTEDLTVNVVGSFIPHDLFGRFHIIFAFIRMLYLCLYIMLFDSNVYNLVVTDSAGFYTLPFFKLLSIPTFFYCHFPDLLLCTHRKSLLKKIYRYPFDWVEERCTLCADKISANSNFSKGILLSTFHSIAAKSKENDNYLSVLYPAIDISRWPKRRNLKLFNGSCLSSKDSITFVSINRYERKKNIALAIYAFNCFKDMIFKHTGDTDLAQTYFDKCKLYIAGGYDLRISENIDYANELEKIANDIEIHNNVKFLYSPDDETKRNLLASANAILYTCENEHFGIVPLEAMVSECPVIAANSGGPLETVIDNETGFLCDPSPEAFAHAMFKIITEYDLCKDLGVAGRIHVLKNFSTDKLSENLEIHLSNLIL